MKYSLILLLVIAACQSKKEGTKDPITGKWLYETIELYSGEKFDTQDSLYNLLHTQHVGMKISFSGRKTFEVSQQKPNAKEEFIARQDYELAGDTVLRLINTGRPHDEFPIISLSDSLFKVNLFNSPLGYLVFRKME